MLLSGVLLCLFSLSQVIIIQLNNVHYVGATTYMLEKGSADEIVLANPFKLEYALRGYYFDRENETLYILNKEGFPNSTYTIYEFNYSNRNFVTTDEFRFPYFFERKTGLSGLYFYNNSLLMKQVDSVGSLLIEFSLDSKTFRNSSIRYPTDLHPELPPDIWSDWFLLGIWQDRLIFLESIHQIGKPWYGRGSEYKDYIGEYSIDTLERLKRTEIKFTGIQGSFPVENGVLWFEEPLWGGQWNVRVLAGYSLEASRIIKIIRGLFPAIPEGVTVPSLGHGPIFVSGVSIQDNSLAVVYTFRADWVPINDTRFLYSLKFSTFTEYDELNYLNELIFPGVCFSIGGSLLILVIAIKWLKKRNGKTE